MTEITMKQCSKKDKCVHPEADKNGWLPADLEHFGKAKARGKFRLTSECKKCLRKRAADYRAAHPERKKAAARLYYERHGDQVRESVRSYRSEHRDVRNRYNRQYYREHQQELIDYQYCYRSAHYSALQQKSREYYRVHLNRIREYKREYSTKHPDRIREKSRRYRKHHREQIKVAEHRRRARKRQLAHTFSDQNWQRALDYFADRCAVCGRTKDFWTTLAQDHWVPVAEGGAYTADNIVPLCHGRPGIPTGEPCCNNAKGKKQAEQWLIECFGIRRAAEILQRVNAYFEWVKAQDSDHDPSTVTNHALPSVKISS